MEFNNRILIVDDNKNIHEDFYRVLHGSRGQRLNDAIMDLETSLFGEEDDEGNPRKPRVVYRIDSAYSGDEALEMVIRSQQEEDPYSVVFTDVRMAPGLDGIQLVGEIQKHAPFTEVVVVTAFSDYSWEEMNDRIGQADRLLFLRKPFDTVTIKQIALTLTKKWSLGYLARKQLESLQMNRVVIDEMRDAVFWFGPEGNLFSINEKAWKSLDYSRNDLLKRSLFDICAGFEARTWPDFWKAFRREGSRLVESSLTSRQGKLIPVEIALSSMEHGEKEFGCAVVRDLTDRKRTEKRLSKLEERWKFLWENVPDAIIELDFEGKILICNRMIGDFDANQAIGTSLFSYLPEDQHQNLRNIMAQVRLSGDIGYYETPVITPTASTWWANRIMPMKRENEITGILMIGADITERKHAEEALRKSEYRLAEAQRIARIGNWEWDFSNGDIFWSEEMYRIFAYDQDEGSPTLDTFFQRTHPEDRDILQEAIEATIRRGRPLMVEYRIVMPNNSIRVIYANARVERTNGQPTRLLGTAQDISEHRKVEKERASLEAQLQQVQKMETLGTLAGGIAHDFNNILTPILGYTEMALENAPEDSRIHEDLQQALKAANRAKELVQQILVFSRHVEHKRRPIEFANVLKEAVKLIRAWLPTTIEIRLDTGSGQGMIEADPTQLHQVMMNLCTNAYHAMRDGGAMEIRLERIEVDEDLARSHPNLKIGTFLRLMIRDNGHGMDQATMSRAFEPFFTTKGVGDGTGLGLSVVHGIVTGHDGVITLESEPGKGTTFYIFFPCVQSEEEQEDDYVVQTIKGKERILFVDDEKIIAEMGQEMLSRMGYEVMTCSGSVEALELFQSDPERFDLVITDQTMPRLTGTQLSRAIMEIRSDIPVILISGFSESITAEESKKMGIREYVSKPILAHDLNRAIRRVLDS